MVTVAAGQGRKLLLEQDDLGGAAIRPSVGERHLYLGFDRPRPCLSSAPLNGGFRVVDQVLNLHVSGQPVAEAPDVSLQAYATAAGWSGTTVGMMTAARPGSLRHRHCRYHRESLALWLTCGLDNARRAGDPHDWQGELAPPPGTINTVLVTSLTLSPATMVELMMVLTEAKCATLQKLGITSPVSGQLATGTGTDATAIVAGHGGEERWAGKHTLLGERSAQLMMAALEASISNC